MPTTIQKGIPLPPKKITNTKYPWDKLKVGDSFVVEGRTNGRQLCIQAGLSRSPKRFESRVIDGVCRVWRVA